MVERRVDVEIVVKIHDEVIKSDGGATGVRDYGLIAAAIGRMDAGFGDTEIHVTPFEKAAALLDGIANTHPFVDGNKRTAFLCAQVFLDNGGVNLSFEKWDGIRFMLSVVNERLPICAIALWLEEHVDSIE